jgi:hypothetical protein
MRASHQHCGQHDITLKHTATKNISEGVVIAVTSGCWARIFTLGGTSSNAVTGSRTTAGSNPVVDDTNLSPPSPHALHPQHCTSYVVRSYTVEGSDRQRPPCLRGSIIIYAAAGVRYPYRRPILIKGSACWSSWPSMYRLSEGSVT